MSGAVVCAPMAVEERALSTRRPSALRVERTGHGREHSVAAAARLASGSEAGLVIAGVAGGLSRDLPPGTLVVASEVRSDDRAPIPCASAPLLAGALNRSGFPAVVGAIHSSPRLVTGRARTTLAATGVVAVDMESRWLADAAAGRPLAVVRAIVDAPGRPLLSPATVPGGVQALRALRAAVPVLRSWSAALGEREVRIGPAQSGTRRADLLLVLGSHWPRETGPAAAAYLVDDLAQVDLTWLSGEGRIEIVVSEPAYDGLGRALIECLEGLGHVTVRRPAPTDTGTGDDERTHAAQVAPRALAREVD